MIKLTGILLIIAVGAYAGHKASQRLSQRVTLLEDVDTFLSLLATQLRYTASPMDLLLSSLLDNQAVERLHFPKACCRRLYEGEAFPLAWKQSLEEIKVKMQVKGQDLSPLDELGEQLGCTDVEGQLAIIALAQKKVRKILAEAREYRQKNGSLYRTLGLLTGIFVVLITI